MDEIDEKEYSYSEEKRIELLSKAGASDDIIAESNPNSSSNFDFSTKETERKQLCIYIRNYDSEGNLLDSPVNAIKTCIDTFEKSIIDVEWDEKEAITLEDGTTSYKKVHRKESKEGVDGSIFADPEILKVNPITIDYRTFFNLFICNYFSNYEINKNKGGKTLYIEFHNTSDEYTNYYLSDEDLEFFINKNFDIIGLNLDNRTFEIKTTNLISLTTLSIENTKIVMSNETGFSLKSNYLYLENINIISEYYKVLPVFSCTVENVEIKYLSFEKEICKFDFLNPVSNDMQKWMQTSLKIYGLEFLNKDTSYNFPLERLFNFKSYYSVTISSVNLTLDEIELNIFKFANIYNLNLNSFNFNINKIKKNCILMEKITNLIACSIYCTQINSASGDLYLFFSSGSLLLGEQKYTGIITTNIGLIKSSDDNCEQMSFNNVRVNKFNKPINRKTGSTNKIIFSSCNFENISELELSIPKLSIFNSRFANVEYMNLVIEEKLYMTNTSFTGNKCQINLNTKSSSLLFEDSNISFKELIIGGTSGNGNINISKCSVNSNDIKFISLNKLSSKNSLFETKAIELSGANINSFCPSFENGSLRDITLSGVVKNSLLNINNPNEATINFNIEACKGNVYLNYSIKPSNTNMIVKDSMIEVVYDSIDTETEKNITLLCKSGCEGSIFTTKNEKLKFVPKAEGEFTKFKQYKENDIRDLKKNIWKEKIAYGYSK